MSLSVSFRARVEMAIKPFTLDDLVKELRKRRPRREAMDTASAALEIVRDYL